MAAVVESDAVGERVVNGCLEVQCVVGTVVHGEVGDFSSIVIHFYSIGRGGLCGIHGNDQVLPGGGVRDGRGGLQDGSSGIVIIN